LKLSQLYGNIMHRMQLTTNVKTCADTWHKNTFLLKLKKYISVTYSSSKLTHGRIAYPPS